MYPSLVRLVGGVPIFVDTYPDFRIDVDQVAAKITPRTKAILFNSPANPTGVTASVAEIRALAELAAERNVVLVSDEIYSLFHYDAKFVSPAAYNPAHAGDRWFFEDLCHDRLARRLCAWPERDHPADDQAAAIHVRLRPQPAQWAGAVALDVDMQPHVAAYRQKRDRLVAALSGSYEIETPGGAFYIFPTAPWGTASEFVAEAIRNELLIIPSNIFSERDTHFRISYAATDAVLDRGIEVLQKLAHGPR